jgi:hypothetical protein
VTRISGRAGLERLGCLSEQTRSLTKKKAQEAEQPKGAGVVELKACEPSGVLIRS